MPSRHDPSDSLADMIENAERIAHYLDGVDHFALPDRRGTSYAERATRCSFRRKWACRILSRTWAKKRGGSIP